MWSHWQRETHFTQHAWCSWSPLSYPHSPLLLKRPTHMYALTVAKISALAVLSRAVLLLCRQTNSMSSSGVPIHQTGADQPSPAGCCNLSALVCTSSESGCATSGSDPAPEPPSLHRQNPKKIDEQPKLGAGSQVQGTANGTSGRILNGPVSSWLNGSNSDIGNLLIFPPCPLWLLWNVMPYLVSMCFITFILTSIHSFPSVLFRDLNTLELWLTLIHALQRLCDVSQLE